MVHLWSLLHGCRGASAYVTISMLPSRFMLFQSVTESKDKERSYPLLLQRMCVCVCVLYICLSVLFLFRHWHACVFFKPFFISSFDCSFLSIVLPFSFVPAKLSHRSRLLRSELSSPKSAHVLLNEMLLDGILKPNLQTFQAARLMAMAGKCSLLFNIFDCVCNLSILFLQCVVSLDCLPPTSVKPGWTVVFFLRYKFDCEGRFRRKIAHSLNSSALFPSWSRIRRASSASFLSNSQPRQFERERIPVQRAENKGQKTGKNKEQEATNVDSNSFLLLVAMHLLLLASC